MGQQLEGGCDARKVSTSRQSEQTGSGGPEEGLVLHQVIVGLMVCTGQIPGLTEPRPEINGLNASGSLIGILKG